MKRTISAAEANRSFSKLLREVSNGETYVITSHGKPRATMAPAREPADALGEAARQLLLQRLAGEPIQNLEKWTRQDLYDR